MAGRRCFTTFFYSSVLLALLCATGYSSAAPQRQGRAGGAGGQQPPIFERITKVLDTLNLTADQKKQTDQIIEETREDITGMAKDLKGLTPEARREKLKPVIKEMIEKITSVLTQEQKAQLRQKLEANRQEKGKGGPAAAGAKANADALPTTQPNNDAVAPTRGPLLQRVHDRLAKLDLSPQQQTKVDAILDDAGKKFQDLRQDAQADAAATRDKAKDLMQSTREQIAAVLTPEQQQKWRESADPNRTPPTADSPKLDAPKTESPKGAAANNTNTTPDTTAAKAAAASSIASPDAPPASAVPSKTKSLYEGAAAPPFRLTRLNGSAVTLDSFQGKPLVLIFGSFTSPTFRDKVPQIDQLSKKYKGRATVLIVYTREAYPVNEWEVQRNLNEQIKVDQHKSLDERTKLAKMTQDGLKITSDIAVDDIDDGTTDAYDAMPNGAYVIANGKIVVRQKWADPLGLAAWIDIAIKKSK